ncbi:hypothetical protein CDD82_3207 [Ophiocordyceps australis]|uniref:Uncharacterized protein n=1 Tax=Ophiocordyceps australis TaxID=1399860 RepID=A0A2C5YJ20_9HYPO|nr:hypothetical protein CDD82_3207 [Ophiocordyceps australis]
MQPLVVAALFLAAAANTHALLPETQASHVAHSVLDRRQGNVSASAQEAQRYRLVVQTLVTQSADAAQCYYALNTIPKPHSNNGQVSDHDFGKQIGQCNEKYASAQSLLNEAQLLARQASIRQDALSDAILPQVQSNPHDKENALGSLARVSAQANSLLSSAIAFAKPPLLPSDKKSAKEDADELHKIEKDLVNDILVVLHPHISKLMMDLDKFVMLKKAKHGASDKDAVQAGNQAVAGSLKDLQAKADDIVHEALGG